MRYHVIVAHLRSLARAGAWPILSMAVGIGLVVAACADVVPAASPPRASVPVAGTSASADGKQPSGLKRSNQGGNVTVDVTWEKDAAAGALAFAVVMDTHSVDLDGVDLGKVALLRTDDGKQVAPQSWDAPPGGHHRTGRLVFPGKTNDVPVLEPQTKSIELVVRDVAGVKERSFVWEVTS